MADIEWNEQTVSVKDLKPYERNPRKITESQFKKLKESIEQDGYHARIKVNSAFQVVGGHQRLKALKELGYDEIKVLVPSRPITDAEFERILLRDNHNNGTFDIDMLANGFDLEFLRDVGLHDVMNIAPMGEEEPEGGAGGKKQVKCPKCEEVFPIKGNSA